MEKEYVQFDFFTLWKVLKKRFLSIMLTTIMFGAVGMTLDWYLHAYFIEPSYSATALLLVQNKVTYSESSSIDINDMNASARLSTLCIQMFSSTKVTNELLIQSGNNEELQDFKERITIKSLSNTELLSITYTDDSPEKAESTVNKYVDLCVKTFDDNIETGSIKIFNYGMGMDEPDPDGIPNLALLAAIIGFLIAYISSYLIEMFDTKVKAEDDLFAIYNIPVFAEIMKFDYKGKGDDYKYE